MMSIPEYFAGQSILLTGGTGLMGKVLIEKILRSCPDVDKIFLLIRPKKSVPIEERWKKLTDIPLFENLKSEKPEALEKVHLIAGDMTQKNLGLSTADSKLLIETVTIVYHVAAMIQFTDSMRDALLENVKGTYRLLELAKSIINLKVFVHMSTAYSNSNKPPKESVEEILTPCQDWKVMLKMEELYPSELEFLKEKLLDGHPNPYTWSKSLAEQVVNEYRSHFPTIVMRPGIVCSTVEDPIVGWIDAANGFSAHALAAAFGAIRVVAVDGESHFDFVPVDFAIKASLIAPWKRQVASKQNNDKSEKTTTVFNCVCMNTSPITNMQITDWGLETMNKYPSENTVWVPSLIFTTNEFFMRILCLLLQVLPAVAADLVLFTRGKRTRATRMTKKLVNIWRMTRNLRSLSFAFPNERFASLPEYVRDEDKPAFSYNINFNLEKKKEIIADQTIGFRKYFLKEDFSEEAIKRNNERLTRIKLMHKIVTSLGYLITAWCLVTYCKGPIIHLLEQL